MLLLPITTALLPIEQKQNIRREQRGEEREGDRAETINFYAIAIK